MFSWEPLLGATLPLFFQYLLGMAGLALFNLLATGRYLSSAESDRPQISSCTCNRRPGIPDGQRWVICDRCKGIWDRRVVSIYVIAPLFGLMLSYVALCLVLGKKSPVDKGFEQEVGAMMLAMSVNWTAARFWARGLAPIARRLRSERAGKASEVLIQRLDQYHKQKELRKAENSIMSEALLDPSVLTGSEHATLLAAVTFFTAAFSLLLGAWFSLVPAIAMTVVSIALPEGVETLLEHGTASLMAWFREEWRNFIAPSQTLKKADKTAAELAAELAKETDPIRVRAIEEALLQVANTVRGALGSELIEVCRSIDALQKRVRSGEPKSDAEWTVIWREHASSHRRLAELEAKIAERVKERPSEAIAEPVPAELSADVPVPMTDDTEQCASESSCLPADYEKTLRQEIQLLDERIDALTSQLDGTPPATTDFSKKALQTLLNSRAVYVLRRRSLLYDELDKLQAKTSAK